LLRCWCFLFLPYYFYLCMHAYLMLARRKNGRVKIRKTVVEFLIFQLIVTQQLVLCICILRWMSRVYYLKKWVQFWRITLQTYSNVISMNLPLSMNLPMPDRPFLSFAYHQIFNKIVNAHQISLKQTWRKRDQLKPLLTSLPMYKHLQTWHFIHIMLYAICIFLYPFSFPSEFRNSSQ